MGINWRRVVVFLSGILNVSIALLVTLEILWGILACYSPNTVIQGVTEMLNLTITLLITKM